VKGYVGPEPFNTPADCAGKIKKWEKGISPKKHGGKKLWEW
jgi:hypothetical protein